MARFSTADLWLADQMFSHGSHGFAWRDHWFAAELMHRWAKIPLVLLGLLVLVAAAADGVRPFKWMSNTQRLQLRVVAACAALVPLVVSVWKRLSASHCPWDIDRYGGHAPYVALLDAMPAGVAPGGCFPAGHATSVLWMMGLCVWFLPHKPRQAALVAALMALAGLAFGWVQQLRGAHFLSHTLWSIWVAAGVTWLVLLVATLWQQRRRSAAVHTSTECS